MLLYPIACRPTTQPVYRPKKAAPNLLGLKPETCDLICQLQRNNRIDLLGFLATLVFFGKRNVISAGIDKRKALVKFIGRAKGMKVATVQHVNGELALLLCPLSFVEMSLFID